MIPRQLYTYDHVAVVTLVGYERVVGEGVEHHPPVSRVLRHRAAHGWNNVTVGGGEAERENVITRTLRQIGGAPGPVSLTVAVLPTRKVEARLASVGNPGKIERQVLILSPQSSLRGNYMTDLHPNV